MRWHDWRRAAVLAERMPALYAFTRFNMALRSGIALVAILATLLVPTPFFSGAVQPFIFAALVLACIAQSWAMAAPIAILRSRYCDEFPRRLVFAMVPMLLYPLGLVALLAAIGPQQGLVLAALAVIGGISRSQHQRPLYSSSHLYVRAGLETYVESGERARSTLKGLVLALVIFLIASGIAGSIQVQIAGLLSAMLMWDFIDSRVGRYNHEYLWLGSMPGGDDSLQKS